MKKNSLNLLRELKNSFVAPKITIIKFQSIEVQLNALQKVILSSSCPIK